MSNLFGQTLNVLIACCCQWRWGVGDKRKEMQLFMNNCSILLFDAPPVIDAGNVKMCTAAWENVDKQMTCNTKLTHEHVSNDLKMWKILLS